MKLALTIIAAAAGCGSSAPVKSTGTSTKLEAPAAAPDLAALREILEPHEANMFSTDAIARGCPPEDSLGVYLEMLVENGIGASGSQDIHRLTGHCGEFPAQAAPIDPPADPEFWYCVVDAYTADQAGESPWHYELRVRVRKADRQPDLVTIACPGAP